MRKTLIILAIIAGSAAAKAQQGYDFISITGYRSNSSTFGTKAGLEFSRIYNRRFALYANYFQNFKGSYKEYTIEVFYKPNLFQNRNMGMRMVFGGDIGTNQVDFQAVPQIGFEWYLVFKNNCEVSLSPYAAYATAGPYFWRYQVQAAIKFPLL